MDPTTPPQKKRSGIVVFGLWFFAIIVVLGVFISSQTAPPADQVSASTPDEPCRVEAPQSARAAAENWCQGGVFTLVNVSNDARNFVVVLQLSRKTFAVWPARRSALLDQFRGLTDEMATATDMNVAFSLHDPAGNMLGGCARQRGAGGASCN